MPALAGGLYAFVATREVQEALLLPSAKHSRVGSSRGHRDTGDERLREEQELLL